MADSKKTYRALPVVMLFLVVAAALLIAGWAPISTANLEVRDYAANSLLIADAKHFRLLYGNYSRVGFYHPGPAILYVLAAGELVLHDWLHLVASPLSGQLAAVCLYNAGWIALIFAMMRRIAGGTGLASGNSAALLFVSAALLTIACADHRVFNGIWMPLMYFFPFAAMLVAISRLVYGHTDMLRALAVSSGFLINGHASFIPILGMTLIVVLIGNWLVTRQQREGRIVTRAFLAAHRRELLVAGVLLLLFFVPLIILTIVDFPGPLYQYFTFGRGSRGNKLADAFRYVAVYWGGGWGLAWGLMLVVLLLKGVHGPHDSFVRAARSLGVAFVAATVALLYYARKAIDQLNETYIGLFYYAVPMLAAALVALYVYEAARGRRKAVAAWVLSAGALAGTWIVVTKVPAFDYFYNRPAVVTLYDAIKGLPGQGRVVFDLEENTDGWGEIWGNTLGLQAYALRRGQDLICINQGWNISNTFAAKCRPEELNTKRRFLVRTMGAPHPELGDPDLDGMNLALYRHGVLRTPPLPYVRVKEQPQVVAGMLGGGWGDVDGDFVWSVGPVAAILVPRGASEVRLDLGSYVPTLQSRLPVQAYVNGKLAARWEFDSTDFRRQVLLTLDPGAAGQRIELRMLDPKSPKDLGLGEDARKLGVALWGIRIKE